MGWYLQGQDPSGRVGGAASGRRRCSFPEATEEGRQGQGDDSGRTDVCDHAWSRTVSG